MKTTISAQRKGNSGAGTGIVRKLRDEQAKQQNPGQRGRGGWKQDRDVHFMLRQQQRNRLRMRGYDPKDDVDALVAKFLKKNKVKKLKPGMAFGATRSVFAYV